MKTSWTYNKEEFPILWCETCDSPHIFCLECVCHTCTSGEWCKKGEEIHPKFINWLKENKITKKDCYTLQELIEEGFAVCHIFDRKEREEHKEYSKMLKEIFKK